LAEKKSLPMNDSDQSAREEEIREMAARWTVRRDRGLSAAESIEFELWLAVDPQHGPAMERAGRAWARLDRLPDEVAQATLTAAARRRSFWRRGLTFGSLAAAAALAVWFQGYWVEAPPPAGVAAPLTLQAAGPRVAVLADGTTVRLNTGSEIVEEFSGKERSVLLVRGEAHFLVIKDQARPFVVRAGALRVRAVGTAFNVHLQSAQVEVLVTEGRVAVGPAPSGEGGKEPLPAGAGLPPDLAELGAGELLRVEVSGSNPAKTMQVVRMAPTEISRALAWQDDLLRLGGATLAEIAGSFERRTGRRVILADPALAGLRLGGRFRADDIDGFASLLVTTLDIEVERTADGTLVLRKIKSESR
jgi:transmembrane sensor